jgi:hypothetical protein
MTFVLALANNDYVVQVSDRRLTCNGVLTDDESNKAGFLVCDDARLVFAFSGLAEHGQFKTRRWILETLLEVAPPDHSAREILERFTLRATDFFRTSQLLGNVPRCHKRLSIMFTGFSNDGRTLNCIVTNFQDPDSGVDLPLASDTFSLYPKVSKRLGALKHSFMQRIGAWRAMTANDERVLREFLLDGKPREAIMNKAVELIRAMADRPAACGTIGKQINSVCLTKSLGPISGYHTDRPTDSIYLIDQVDLRKVSTPLAISDLHFQVSGPVVAVPKVGRNRPCPCGSMKKYKHCHGR